VRVLAVFGPEPQRLLGAIVVAPLQGAHLAHPPRRPEEKAHGVGQVRVGMRPQGVDLVTGEEALADATRITRRFGDERLLAELLGA
jgi:hypothetical protein